jgi:hypothetical protein
VKRRKEKRKEEREITMEENFPGAGPALLAVQVTAVRCN